MTAGVTAGVTTGVVTRDDCCSGGAAGVSAVPEYSTLYIPAGVEYDDCCSRDRATDPLVDPCNGSIAFVAFVGGKGGDGSKVVTRDDTLSDRVPTLSYGGGGFTAAASVARVTPAVAPAVAPTVAP